MPQPASKPLSPRAPAFRRPPELLLALIGIGALVLRLALWPTQLHVSIDGTTFIRLARAMAGGPEIASSQPLGYPLLILLARPLSGDWVTAARAVDLVFGLALIPLAWMLARRYLRSPYLALLPALALACLPLPVRYSLTTMSETPFVAFLLILFLLTTRGRPFPGGLAGGFAYAIRPEALLAVGGVALLYKNSRRDRLRLLAGCALVVGLHVAAVGVWQGQWGLSGKGANVAGGDWRSHEIRVEQDPETRTAAGGLVRGGRSWLTAYPSRLGALAMNLWRSGGWVAPVLAPLGALGGGLSLVGGLLYLLLLPLSFIAERVRFVLPAIPFVMILAAVALDRRPRRTALLGSIAVLLGIGATAYLDQEQYRTTEDGAYPELVIAGEFLASYATGSTVVYDRKPYTAFYAGADMRYIPTGTYDEVVDAVVSRGGDYLVINDQVARVFRPELLRLVEDPRTIATEHRLAPIYYARSGRDLETVIYRVVRAGGPPPLPGEERIRPALARQAGAKTP